MATMVVRAEGFCTGCRRRLFVRTHDAQWVMPVLSFENIRSGCCNAYVSHLIRPVPIEGCFTGMDYASVDRPMREEFALAGPGPGPDATEAPTKGKGRK